MRKNAYPYGYMSDWENFNETLPEKEDFYSHLDMEHATGADCVHTKIVCKYFEIKNLTQYHNLYLKSNTLFLANVFENFRNTVLEYILQNVFQLLD